MLGTLRIVYCGSSVLRMAACKRPIPWNGVLNREPKRAISFAVDRSDPAPQRAFKSQGGVGLPLP